MDIRTQGFTHFPPTNIRNGVQRQAVVELIMIQKVLFDAVDDEVKEVVALIEEKCNGEISYLLLRVLRRRYQVDCLQMPKVDIPAKYVDVEQLNN